ncbi:MAG TPA: putative beta-lysine N-acetyltransferase [Bacteroidaceae bacterium]|nr:putative beta-lysine N-acetyltransferase [Bacteroidaceae bacterium]
MIILDKIERVEGALIHHGPYNDRLYILKFPSDGNGDTVRRLTEKAYTKGYSKIVGKIPKRGVNNFLDKGYSIEAVVPRFYNNRDSCYFVAKYLNSARKKINSKKLDDFKLFIEKYQNKKTSVTSGRYQAKELDESDISDISALFRQVFDSYPFPIHKKKYIYETMCNSVLYYGIYIDSLLMSVSSAEMDRDNQNAEMTDFAVLDSARGLGLSKILLDRMEVDMQKRDIKTLYSIARMESMPMNRTFLSSGYIFAGCLKNNTNIAGGIESMNVWYKHI